MHTTPERLSALSTLWLGISFPMILVACTFIWAIPILGITVYIALHYQDAYDEWNAYHTDDIDIKMWADMDRPE